MKVNKLINLQDVFEPFMDSSHRFDHPITLIILLLLQVFDVSLSIIIACLVIYALCSPYVIDLLFDISIILILLLLSATFMTYEFLFLILLLSTGFSSCPYTAYSCFRLLTIRLDLNLFGITLLLLVITDDP